MGPRAIYLRMKKARLLLDYVYINLRIRKRFCENHQAINKRGNPVDPSSKEAVAWNLEGACYRDYSDLKGDTFSNEIRSILLDAFNVTTRNFTEYESAAELSKHGGFRNVMNVIKLTDAYLAEKHYLAAAEMRKAYTKRNT